MEFSGKNPRVGCHFLLQAIFPTQGLNLGLLNCRQILYRLNHQGAESVIRIYPFFFFFRIFTILVLKTEN